MTWPVYRLIPNRSSKPFYPSQVNLVVEFQRGLELTFCVKAEPRLVAANRGDA
jgi:hypothetical protein